MALGDGVFILRETLTLGEGLVVAGAGKGATLLVADNGVNVAVATTGRARVSDLTIVNSQPGRAEATGLLAQGPVLELHEAVIEVGGAARSLGVGKRSVQSIEILDSEITVVGQDSTGIETLIPADPGSIMTLERSAVSAGRTALDENEVDIGPQVRVVDSRVFGHIFYNPESSLLEIVRSQIVGNVGASNDNVRVRITDSHIKGSVGVSGLAAHVLDIIDTIIEGSVHADHSSGLTFDGLQLLGELRLEEAAAEIRRSYISSASTAAALSLGRAVSVELEQTFVQGAVAVAVEAASELQSSSSVLSGPISASTAAVISCTETYGADYELLSAVCQPQVP
jgi:hypothetical protein